MIKVFEGEDERGVLLPQPIDDYAQRMAYFIKKKFRCEAIYIIRWANDPVHGRFYQGTAHLANDIIYLKCIGTKFYYLPKKLKGNAFEGKDIVELERTKVVFLDRIEYEKEKEQQVEEPFIKILGGHNLEDHN